MSVTTSALPLPGKPSGVTVDSTDTTSVTLSWTDLNDVEEGYNILRDGVVVGTVGPDVTTFTDTGLTDGIDYVYTI